MEPGYFVLPIASGDFVVADPAFKQWLISHDRMRAVVEMESAGAARAVKEHDQDSRRLAFANRRLLRPVLSALAGSLLRS